MCCCCLFCGCLAEEQYSAARRHLYSDEESTEESPDGEEEEHDATDASLFNTCATFIMHNHPLGHVWLHRHDSQKVGEKIFIILLALLNILPSEVAHHIYGHQGATWNQMLCGLSDGFFPLMSGATNFCLLERALEAISQLIHRGTGLGKCLGISSLIVIVVCLVVGNFNTFYYMEAAVPVGKIILVCFEVVLFALFVVDTVLLVCVFFITQPTALELYGSLAEPPIPGEGADVEFAALAEGDIPPATQE